MRRRRRLRLRRLLPEALLLLAIGALLPQPRLVTGGAALEWTRYHARRVGGPGSDPIHLREGGRWAAQVIDTLAPLPGAAEAAGLAVGLGRTADPRQREAALALCTEVRGALDRMVGRWRGLGLGGVREEARLCEEERRLPTTEARRSARP
jgi:hypothetical protein